MVLVYHGSKVDWGSQDVNILRVVHIYNKKMDTKTCYRCKNEFELSLGNQAFFIIFT